MVARFAFTALLALMATVAVAETRSDDWAEYRDAVYNCRIEYPNSIFTQDAWDAAEEFQRFSGSNEHTYFRIMGAENEDRLTPAGVKAKYLAADVSGDVVYERTKKNFVVLSGYRGDSIFYSKVAVSADKRKLCIFEITYPRAAKRAFDRAVTRMSLSFKVD